MQWFCLPSTGSALFPEHDTHAEIQLCVTTQLRSMSRFIKHASVYTPSQRGNYHHCMFHNPTAAVNLFHVGKQYLTLCKAKAAVTHNLIGRKIISNVKHSDARNSLPILDVIRSSHKLQTPQWVRVL